MAKLESSYRVELKSRIRKRLPGCIILRNDPTYMQGIPDWLILFENMWAMLEIKRAAGAVKQANQDHWVKIFGKMSFAAFIEPSNEEEVLCAMESAFGLAREACSSKS